MHTGVGLDGLVGPFQLYNSMILGQWNQLPQGGRGLFSHTGGLQEAAGQPSARDALRWIPAMHTGVGLDGLVGPFHLYPSMILGQWNQLPQGGRGLFSHTGGLQEAAGQPSVRDALRWIPARRRGLD